MKIIQQPLLIEMNESDLRGIVHLLHGYGMDTLIALYCMREKSTETSQERRHMQEQHKIRTIQQIVQYLGELGEMRKIVDLMERAFIQDLTDVYEYINGYIHQNHIKGGQ